ncbi:hypothetical protein [Nocardia cyriacigeorgica]|uniref:hypothetical protein n=1 Tax=Nocardia cyriacigeorgica TaxID=135487 RepID=UPI00245892A9|nr:hypothetical protein [Nocardia cyriacigeorgica]
MRGGPAAGLRPCTLSRWSGQREAHSRQSVLVGDRVDAGDALARETHERTLDYTAMPRVIFTSPAIASVELTEAEAIEAGSLPYSTVLGGANVPRALVDHDTRALVNIVADAATGRVLGVHAVVGNAGDLITAAGYVITAGMTVGQLARGWAPYLTMAEALKLAAQTFTTDVATLSCCAGSA